MVASTSDSNRHSLALPRHKIRPASGLVEDGVRIEVTTQRPKMRARHAASVLMLISLTTCVAESETNIERQIAVRALKNIQRDLDSSQKYRNQMLAIDPRTTNAAEQTELQIWKQVKSDWDTNGIISDVEATSATVAGDVTGLQ